MIESTLIIILATIGSWSVIAKWQSGYKGVNVLILICWLLIGFLHLYLVCVNAERWLLCLRF